MMPHAQVKIKPTTVRLSVSYQASSAHTKADRNPLMYSKVSFKYSFPLDLYGYRRLYPALEELFVLYTMKKEFIIHIS